MKELNLEEDMVNKMSKRKKTNGFKRFLMIYTAALAIVICLVWILLYGLLKDYEGGRPASTMDKIISQFTVDNVESLLNNSGVTYNEFESNQIVATYLKGQLTAGAANYKKKSGEYAEENPVYVVYAGETAIAKVTLAADGKNGHNFTKWKMGAISFDGYADKKQNNSAVTIQVPKGAQLSLNNVPVSAQYISADDQLFDPCKHVADYVTPPVDTVYTIQGLLVKPEISVVLNGTQLTIQEDTKKNTYTALYPADDTLLAQQQDYIKTIAESYGKYIINRGSLSTLSGYMVGYAKDYVSDIPAVWAFLYGKTYTYEFQNENITNFSKYSDNCFSCDVYYDLYVDYQTGNTTYNTSLTYTFVKINGKWYVADFIIN